MVSPVNFLHICRTVFLKDASGGLLLYVLHFWVSTGVVPVKNDVLLLVPAGKVLELGFPNAFNERLIKCRKIVSCVMQNSEKIWEMTRNLGAHPAQLLNPIISKFCYSFYMVITPCNFKYCYTCYCFLTLQYQNFANLPHGIFLFQESYLISLQIGRNHVAIIISIISNITVLVSHNFI